MIEMTQQAKPQGIISMISTLRNHVSSLVILALVSGMFHTAPTHTVEVPKWALIPAGIFAVSAVAHAANSLKQVQRVGVVTIEGVMKESSKTIDELQSFFKNNAIKAIVLKINSGGGAAGTAQAIYHVINELKKTHPKPVIAWVENVAASGAYYAACAADVIIATPSAVVGSVGVIAQVWQLKNLLKRFDISKEIITSGDYKASFDSWNEMTSEQKTMYQELCNNTYKRFVGDVQECRPRLQELPIEEWADGKIFDAERGLALGMVDVLGSQLTVEQTIKTLTKNNQEILFVFPPSLPLFMRNLDQQKLAVATLIDELFNRVEQKIAQSRCVVSLMVK